MPNRHRRGTQSIERAIDLLFMVATRRKTGWRLTDLVSHSSLDDSTVLRIMSCLSEKRLVNFRSSDRRYRPGAALFQLAVTLPAHFRFQSACHPSLQRIAAATGWSACLHLRAGHQTVLIDRVGEPDAHMLNDLGARRPLWVVSQGIAILLALPPAERREIQRLGQDSMSFLFTPQRRKGHKAILKRSIEHGFGLSLGDTVPGRASMAVPISAPQIGPIASISAHGPLNEFTGSRIERTVRLLRKEADRIQTENAALLDDLAAE